MARKKITLEMLQREPPGVDGQRLYGQGRANWERMLAETREQNRLNRQKMLAGDYRRLPRQARVGREPWGYNTTLAKNCRRLRKQAGFRVGVAATALGLLTSRLQRMESNRTALSAMMIWRMARLYECSLTDFFVGVEEEFDALHLSARVATDDPTGAG